VNSRFVEIRVVSSHASRIFHGLVAVRPQPNILVPIFFSNNRIDRNGLRSIC